MDFISGISFEELERIYREYDDEVLSNRDLTIVLIGLLESYLKGENITVSEYNLFLFVSNDGDDDTAMFNSLRRKYKTITRALNDAREQVVENGLKPLVFVKDGIYREHSLLRDGVDQFYEPTTIVWTDIHCRSVLSDEFQPEGVKCKVLGKGSFYHSSDKCIIPRNGLNLRRNSYVEIECSAISSISLWSTNTSTAIVKNANILFEAKGLGGNKTMEFHNCIFENGIVAFPYSFTGHKYIFNECEILIKEDPDDEVEIHKNNELILTISPDFDGPFIDNDGKGAEDIINEFVVSNTVLDNAYNRYAAAVQIIAQPENMEGNELIMRECVIRLGREGSTGLMMIQKGQAPESNKSRIVLHDIIVLDETSNKDTCGLVIVKENKEDEEVDLLIYSLYTNAKELRYEKQDWVNFEYNFKVYPSFLKDLKDFYEIEETEEDTHISIYQKVENGIGFLRVLHSPDKSIGINIDKNSENEDTGIINLYLSKEAIILKDRKILPIGADKILISDSQDDDNLKYILISDLSIGSAGESNTMSNIGSGANIFASKIGVDFQIRRLTTATPTFVTVQQNGNSVEINFTPPSNTYNYWRLRANTETDTNITDNTLVTFVGTGATTVTRSGTTITINSTDTNTIYTHPTKTWVDKTNLSGASVISNLTVDSLGHLTNWSIRDLTASDIGAEPSFYKGSIIGEPNRIIVNNGTNRLIGNGLDAQVLLHSNIISDISNGVTAFSWGNHALIGYITNVKVLNTTNTTSQTTQLSEVISGTGTISLHRISKTGDYNHLLNLPILFSGNYNDLTNKPTLNFDNYNNWKLSVNSESSIDITSAQTVIFQQAGSVTLSRSGNTITITGASIPTVGNGTITISSGTALSGSASFTVNQIGNTNLTINHANVGHSPVTTGSTLNFGSLFNAISSITINAQGHVTGYTTTTYTLPTLPSLNFDNYGHWRLETGNNGVSVGTRIDIASTDTVRIYGAGDTVVTRATGTATVVIQYNHPNSGVVAGTYNNVTVNAQGHVTSASNVSYLTSLTHNHGIANSAGIQQFTFGINDNIRFEGSGSTTITFNSTDKKVIISSTDTIYTHPTQTAIDTGNLTGAVVISRIQVNTLGHISTVSTRTLTLSDLGYTGITLTGDVTGSGTSSIATTITNKAVTYPKIQDVTGDRILGRLSTLGQVQELTATQVRTFINVENGAQVNVATNITYNNSTRVISSSTGSGATLPLATSSIDGLRRLFSDTVQSVAANNVSSTASRTYGIQVNSSGQLVVNVPWTDTIPATPTLQQVTNAGNTTTLTITASNFITTSDKRVKTNITPIKDAIKLLSKITSYEYLKQGIKEAGFIAQEVKEVLPYTVFDNGNLLTMSDRPILAYIHKGLLELQERLEKIEKNIKL